MIEQGSLSYINSALSELTVNSDDIIPSPDLVSFSLVGTSIDNRRVGRAMTMNNLGYTTDLFRNSELLILHRAHAR